MKEIKIGERNVEILSNIEEFKLGKYMGLYDLFFNSEDFIDEQFLIKFIPLISSLTEKELLNMYEEDMLPFVEEISNFSLDKFKGVECRTFTFPSTDIVYVVTLPQRLSIGETISQKLLDKTAKNEFERWLNILSILIRPGIEHIDEFGKKKYTPVEFDADIDLLNRRKELFREIPAVNAIWILEAFMNGRKK